MSKVQLRQVGMKPVGWRKVNWRQSDNTLDFPSGAIMYFDASKDKPLKPVTYNGKYLVVKNV